MKFNLKESVSILSSTPDVIDSLLSNLTTDWLMSNEGVDTWSPAEIVCHLIHCEDDDWITRMKIILSDDKVKMFTPFDRTFGFEKANTNSIDVLINEFKSKRKKNLEYMSSLNLNENDLNKKGVHPDLGEVTLKQLLATWVVHDFSHIAQINRILAKQYKDETGPWRKYFPILEERKLNR